MKPEKFTPQEIDLMLEFPEPFTREEIEYRFTISHNRDVVFEKHLARIKGEEPKPNFPAMYLGWLCYTLIGVILFLMLFGCGSNQALTGKEHVRMQQEQANYDQDKWARQYKRMNKSKPKNLPSVTIQKKNKRVPSPLRYNQ